MRQVLFVIPGLGLKLPGFGLMFVVACASALYLTAWRARREKLNPDVVFDLAVWLMSGGMIGARLFYVLQHHDSLNSVWDVFKLWQGGIVFYGCIIGGLIGSVIYWARHPFPFLAMCDAVAPALTLGAALGRVGCFLNGCCYGARSNLPWAVRFPATTLPWFHHLDAGLIAASAPYSLAVHPTQLYAVIDGLLIVLLLSMFFPLRRRDGEVMALLMVAYPVTRFLIEGLREDEGAFFAGLTISQNISVLLFLGGLVFWLWLWMQPARRHADGLAADPPIRSSRSPAPLGVSSASGSSPCRSSSRRV